MIGILWKQNTGNNILTTQLPAEIPQLTNSAILVPQLQYSHRVIVGKEYNDVTQLIQIRVTKPYEERLTLLNLFPAEENKILTLNFLLNPPTSSTRRSFNAEPTRRQDKDMMMKLKAKQWNIDVNRDISCCNHCTKLIEDVESVKTIISFKNRSDKHSMTVSGMEMIIISLFSSQQCVQRICLSSYL